MEVKNLTSIKKLWIINIIIKLSLILKKYKWGLIIHSQNKKVAQDVSYEIEKEALLKGYYFSISFSNCAICNKCSCFKEQACANPTKTRPEFHSVGIDVYKTIKKFNLPIQVLKVRTKNQTGFIYHNFAIYENW
jgi:predicted metal-binding protein